MESFYQLPPSSTSHDLPSSSHSLTRPDLQAVTSEWLSLTMDLSVFSPACSLTSTPIPPTPPPLPADLTPFPKLPKPPSPAPTQRAFALSPQTISRTPPFKEGVFSLGHTPVVLPFTQPPLPPPPPPPDPHSSFMSPLPVSPLRYNGSKGFTETAPVFHKPEVFNSTVPQPTMPSTQIKHWQKPTASVNKPPDVKLQVRDPYDEMLSVILDGSSGKDHAESTTSSLVDSSPVTLKSESESRFKLNAEKFHQPSGKPPTVTPSCESAGSVLLEVQFHKPVTMEPLSVIWGGQSKLLSGDDPVKSQRPPSVKERGYTELFIEEEDETLEDKEEDVRVMTRGFSPQVEHGVSCICSLWNNII